MDRGILLKASRSGNYPRSREYGVVKENTCEKKSANTLHFTAPNKLLASQLANIVLPPQVRFEAAV